MRAGRVAIGRRRAVAAVSDDTATATDSDDAYAAAREFARFGRRLGYVLLGLSAVCLCLAAWLMHSAPAALVPAAGALAAAGWDAARG